MISHIKECLEMERVPHKLKWTRQYNRDQVCIDKYSKGGSDSKKKKPN